MTRKKSANETDRITQIQAGCRRPDDDRQYVCDQPLRQVIQFQRLALLERLKSCPLGKSARDGATRCGGWQ
jgi:hypothetical protein